MENERGTHLYPIRINKNTFIYVTKDKCNEEYKRKYIAKLESYELGPSKSKSDISEVNLKELLIGKQLTLEEAAKELKCSVPTIRKYARIYNINYNGKHEKSKDVGSVR